MAGWFYAHGKEGGKLTTNKPEPKRPAKTPVKERGRDAAKKRELSSGDSKDGEKSSDKGKDTNNDEN